MLLGDDAGAREQMDALPDEGGAAVQRMARLFPQLPAHGVQRAFATLAASAGQQPEVPRLVWSSMAQQEDVCRASRQHDGTGGLARLALNFHGARRRRGAARQCHPVAALPYSLAGFR